LESFIKALKIEDENKKIEEFKKVLKKLPNENYFVIKRYISLFVRIVNSEKTLLTPQTMGMVFVNIILKKGNEFHEKGRKVFGEICKKYK
jgi:glucose uptake protein GlcU